MNYGLGGLISAHVDSISWLSDTNKMANDRYGGARLMTFMVYLSNVPSGGHTVFPQLGISVKPVKGSALFWFNIGSDMHFDSRVIHLGMNH